MISEIEQALAQATKKGLIQDGDEYNRESLVSILKDTGLHQESAEKAFAILRKRAREGRAVGGVEIEAKGGGRGRVYRFRARVQSEHRAESQISREQPRRIPPGKIEIHHGDNLEVLRSMPSESVDLIYIDPPFNTGKVQSRRRIKTVRDEKGDRTGFQGKKYRTQDLGTSSFDDEFGDFVEFLSPRMVEALRLLKSDGSFFFHIDSREVHYCKILLDEFFGRDSFMNEIIWAYDYGARSKKKWSSKHDNILWYVKNPKNYTFNYEEMDRIPYMAPGLVGREKAARGKTPTDVWWHTIVPTNGKERTGYATQKPRGILDRIIKVHSNAGDSVLDFFAGSGTTGESAALLGRNCTLVDKSADAIRVMAERLKSFGPVLRNGAAAQGGPSTDETSVAFERNGFADDSV